MDYQLRYSGRKTLAIEITDKGTIIVRAPRQCSRKNIELFLNSKKEWIQKKADEILTEQNSCNRKPLTDEERNAFLERAADLFPQKADGYARIMGVEYNRITIREQKTRWGSCSSRKNLNFNWRLLMAPEPVLDYVVIHELAHLKEMNHSQRFYDIISSVMPDYREHRKWLKQHGSTLWSRE